MILADVGTMVLLVLLRVALLIPVVAVTVVLRAAPALLRVGLLVPDATVPGTAGWASAAAGGATGHEVLLRVVLPVPVIAISVVLLDARELRLARALLACAMLQAVVVRR